MNCQTTTCQPESRTETITQARLVRPRADIVESDGAWLISVELPGVSETDVDLTLESGVLSIQAQSTDFRPEGLQQRYGEFTARRYRRTFRLPEDVDTRSIDATLRNGILKLAVQKLPEAQPQKILVKAGT